MPTSRLIRNLLLCVVFAVCPLLFFTDLTRNPYYTQIALFNVLIPLIWLIWLAEGWKSGELRWVSSPFDFAFWMLISVSLLSWGLSFVAHPAFWKPIYSEGSKAAIFLIVNVALVYVYALQVRDAKWFRTFLWITYAVSFIAALYGVMQYFGIELVWSTNLNPYGSRPVSTFGNPNFMSSFLVVVLPVMAMDYLVKATGCPRSILLMAIAMCTGALLSTLTRSSWVGFVVGMLFVLWGSRSKDNISTQIKILLWGLLLLLIFLWPHGGKGYSATVIERVMEAKLATQENYGSAYQRFLIWLSAWGMVQDHPFFGKGWGCFELFYPFYQGPILFEKALNLRTHANNAHNEILEYWSQIGTVGLGIAIWMWAVFFRNGILMAKRLAGSSNALLWGFMGGVAGMLVDNLLNVSIFFCIPAFIFWWWVGSAMGMDSSALVVRKLDLRSSWKKACLAIASTGLICLMARSVCLWEGEVNFFEGFKLSKGGVDLVSASRHLESAYQWHHLEVNNDYELGNVYARLGDKQNALWMYQRALDANAGYDEIYFNRATMFMQMGRDEEAINNYKVCLAINPTSREAYNALATIYFRNVAKYGAEIEELYQRGVTMYPDDKDMWNNLGYLFTQRQEWPKAASAYQKALEIDPGFALARRNLAVVLQKMGPVSGVSTH
jgi:O-antigen ligase/Tfp pilus assembly protein PilF